MRKNGFRKVLFGIMSFLMFFVLIKESVYADTGEEPEPSVTLEIKNAPEDYYVAILYETGGYYDTDTNLKVQGPVDDSVLEKYLKDFCVQGWEYHEVTGEKNYYYSNSDIEYDFLYIPDAFRVIVVTTDGEVSLSNPYDPKELEALCIYDYSTGEITEDRTVMNIKRTIYVILAYAFTLLIEYIVYLMFGYPNIKDNIACLVILNTTTSIPLYICAVKTPRSGGPGGMLVAFLFYITIFLEGVLYGATLKEKDGSSDTGKNFTYSVVANIVSFFLGGSILESFMTYLGL